MRREDQVLQAFFKTMRPISVPYVLVVESDPDVANVIGAVLGEAGIRTMFAVTKQDALHITKILQPLLILINTCLLDGDGLDLYDQLHARESLAAVSVLLLSTQLSWYQQQFEERGILGLDLPVERDDLERLVLSLLAAHGE
jgi:CheY-like chemotaxis protein